jgi:hypothetical protein
MKQFPSATQFALQSARDPSLRLKSGYAQDDVP